jgi:hypothetical protein
MKAYGEADVYIPIFLTLALVGGEWSASRSGRFTPRESDSGAHWIGGWVASPNQSGQCREEKLLDPTRTQTPNPWLSSLQPVTITNVLSQLLLYRTEVTIIFSTAMCQKM